MKVTKAVLLTLIVCVWWVTLRPARVDERAEFARRLACASGAAAAHAFTAQIEDDPSAPLIRVWWVYLRVRSDSGSPTASAHAGTASAKSAVRVDNRHCRPAVNSAHGI